MRAVPLCLREQLDGGSILDGGTGCLEEPGKLEPVSRRKVQVAALGRS
jgi:hypothetical protein